MPYKDITPPAGDKITRGQTLSVPDHPVIPFIRGDGTGPDIWAASERVFDAAVEKAYGGKKKIAWFEVFAGQAAKDKFDTWLPDDTVEAFREYLVGIKGPLTTPVGGGIRSLERRAAPAARSLCLPAAGAVFQRRALPRKASREGRHDYLPRKHGRHLCRNRISAGTPEANKILDFLAKEFPKEFDKIRFGTQEKAKKF